MSLLQERNLSYHVNETSRTYLLSTRETLAHFAESVTRDYSGPALSFGLPQSQERLEEYLGPRLALCAFLVSSAVSVTHTHTHTHNLVHTQSRAHRRLQNWEAFRSACTVTFSVLILLMSLYMLVAMVRGLLNILAIYRYGEDITYVEGAHQAGTMIKKWVCCMHVCV